MQSAMNRLSAFVRRRRKLVAIGWLVLLLVSIPFASRQTENLTGGGFEAPGSGSAAVDQAVKRFQGASSETLGVVLQRKGGDAAAVQAAVDRVDAGRREGRQRRADRRRRGEGQERRSPGCRRPAAARRDRLARAGARRPPRTCATRSGVGEVKDGVQPYVVGQQALWAGMQELQKDDLEKAETTGFPAHPDRPAGGLRLGAARRCCRPGSASPR